MSYCVYVFPLEGTRGALKVQYTYCPHRHTHSPGPACLLRTLREVRFGGLLVEVSDSSEGADPWTGSSPVAVSAVLAGPQVVGSAPVVGLVVHQPLTVNHVARVNVSHSQAVLDVRAIVAHFLHLAAHVRALVQPDFVGATVLQEQQI